MAAKPVSVPSIQALMAQLHTGLPSLSQNSPETGSHVSVRLMTMKRPAWLATSVTNINFQR